MQWELRGRDWPQGECSRLADCRPHLWHVQEEGVGPTVVLIHGAGGATHSWRGLWPLLRRHYRVIAFDLPGQGFTRMGARMRAGLDPMAQDITALIRQEGWHPAAIIGHSAGAAIALRLAEILPVPPKAIVGINPALGRFKGVAGWLFPMVAKLLALNPLVPSIFAHLSGSERRVRELLASTGSPLDDEGVRLYTRLVSDREHVDATLAMMSQWSLDGLLSRLPHLGTPTLFIVGELDGAVPPSTAEDAARNMPEAQVFHLSGLGHLAHEEAPERVAEAIDEFLEKHLVAC